MKDRIDPLIAERAPWLFSGRPGTDIAHRMLDGILHYQRAVALAEHFESRPSSEIMGSLGRMLAREVEVQGLLNLPRSGAAMIVANHPTGIADGIVLHHLLAPLRPDLFFYANADILRILPQMIDMIAPVEWRQDRRSHGKTRETMAYTRTAMQEGRVGVIFPAGRLAKRRGLRLFERPWMPSAAMIARRFGVPVIPVNIRARNSALFYLFDLVHPTLRDITLFHETLNKERQPYLVRIGEPISAAALPATSEDGIEMLRRASLSLGGRGQPGVSLVQSTRRPSWVRSMGLHSL